MEEGGWRREEGGEKREGVLATWRVDSDKLLLTVILAG